MFTDIPFFKYIYRAYLINFYKLRGKNKPDDILLFVYYTLPEWK